MHSEAKASVLGNSLEALDILTLTAFCGNSRTNWTIEKLNAIALFRKLITEVLSRTLMFSDEA